MHPEGRVHQKRVRTYMQKPDAQYPYFNRSRSDVISILERNLATSTTEVLKIPFSGMLVRTLTREYSVLPTDVAAVASVAARWWFKFFSAMGSVTCMSLRAHQPLLGVRTDLVALDAGTRSADLALFPLILCESFPALRFLAANTFSPRLYNLKLPLNLRGVREPTNTKRPD